MRPKFFLLILLFISLFAALSTAASKEIDIAQAREAHEKGFLSDEGLKVFIKERDINLRDVPYGDVQLLQARSLHMLGLLGDIKNGYRLGEKVSRAEGVVMVVRLMGKEKEAKSGNHSHPFRDVSADYAPYIGYAYQSGLLPKTNGKTFHPDKAMSYPEYVKMVLKILGYEEGEDYSMDNIARKATKIGLPPAPIGNSPFLRKKVMEINANALGVSFKNSIQLLRNYLIETGAISKDTVDFILNQTFERYHPNKRDLLAAVLWKYRNQYDFVSTLDARNGPAPIHPSRAWPSKGIDLAFAGDFRIYYRGEDQSINYKVLKEILNDLQVKSSKIEGCVQKVKNGETCKEINYFTRIIEVKELRRYIRVEVFLEEDK
jgi:hypothetical protein